MPKLVLDSEDRLRWQREDTKESRTERRQHLLAQELHNHAVTVAPDAGRDVSNLLAQIGKPLASQQVQEKLKKCNSRLYFIRKGDLVGVYLIDPGGRVWVSPEGVVMTLKHICGMEAGIMPEFSVIHKTKTEVANQELFGATVDKDAVQWKTVETFASETRGWRTVLIRLLHAGLITRGDVEKHFGWTPSRASRRWYDQTNL